MNVDIVYYTSLMLLDLSKSEPKFKIHMENMKTVMCTNIIL